MRWVFFCLTYQNFSFYQDTNSEEKLPSIINYFPITNNDGSVVFHNSTNDEVFVILNNQTDNCMYYISNTKRIQYKHHISIDR